MCHCNSCNRSKSNCSDPCNWCQSKPVTQSCLPTPCVTGCLEIVDTTCVQTPKDIDLCGTVIPKGTKLDVILESYKSAICNGIPTPTPISDVYVKISQFDTTAGYLSDKITTCNNISKTVTNINGNETLQLCTKLDTVSGSGDNILTSGPNGLYVPPPSTIAQTIVNKTNIPNSGIESFVTVAANLYTISSKIKLDPSSTAPISLTTDGLKVDCCIPVTFTDTNTRLNNPHVSTGAPNGFNRVSFDLLDVVAGTSTLDYQYVDIPANVKLSTDGCNGAFLGTDGGLMVPNIQEPYNLSTINISGDIYLEFKGPSVLSTDYIVEAQGIGFNINSWNTINYTGVGSKTDLLRYYVTDAYNCTELFLRVKYICGNNQSDWVGIKHIVSNNFVSDTSTVTISPSISGMCGEYSIDVAVASQVCANNFTCTRSIVNIGGNFFAKIERGATSINSDVYTINVVSPSLSTNLGGMTVSDEEVALIPLLYYIPGESYQLNVTRHCTNATTGSNLITFPITNLPTTCETSWTDVPNTALLGSIVASSPFNVTNLTNDFRLKYKITGNNTLRFNGYVKFDSTSGVISGNDSGWKNFIDLSVLSGSCIIYPPSIENFEHAPASSTFNYESDSVASGGTSHRILIRRSGSMLQFRALDFTVMSGTVYLSMVEVG